MTCHYKRFTVVIYLSLCLKDSETAVPCRLYRVKNCYNVLFGAQSIVRPRFRTHFADILNSQLMYTVQLLIIKGGLTLILSFPKAWFLLRIRRSNFCCFHHLRILDPRRYCMIFVGISRQKQHLRPLRDDLKMRALLSKQEEPSLY